MSDYNKYKYDKHKYKLGTYLYNCEADIYYYDSNKYKLAM